MKNPPFESADLRRFAEGKPCQMRSEFCNHDPATVVLCHSRRGAGAGMGEKPDDWWAYHGCHGCHSNEHRAPSLDLMLAIYRTQRAVYAHFGTLTP